MAKYWGRIYILLLITQDIPDGSGTRHISAASFSTKEDVRAVFTLSEETSIVRVWKNGVFVEQFSPNEELGTSKDEK